MFKTLTGGATVTSEITAQTVLLHDEDGMGFCKAIRDVATTPMAKRGSSHGYMRLKIPELD